MPIEDVGLLSLQQMHDAGLNPFAVELLTESFLRARARRPNDLTFQVDVRAVQGGYAAHGGRVRITLEAITVAGESSRE